jgi:hypothetical protein
MSVSAGKRLLLRAFMGAGQEGIDRQGSSASQEKVEAVQMKPDGGQIGDRRVILRWRVNRNAARAPFP